jgi:uncharacterized protein YcfJ
VKTFTTDTEEITTEQRLSEEPVNSGDVAEGGLLGAVGGGLVGALAGGPIGAVIGAVLGASASAAAVDLIDRHDHDSDFVPETPIGPGTAYSDESGQIEGLYIVEEVESLSFLRGDVDKLVVRLRAYQLWEERGHEEGFADRDWYDAEYLLSQGDSKSAGQGDEPRIPVLVDEVIITQL